MILTCVLTFVASALQDAGATAPAPATVSAALRCEPGDNSGGLAIRNPAAPGESFTLVTCEALIGIKKEPDLFPIKLQTKDWKSENGRWSYTWEFENKLRLDFSAAPDGDSLVLTYALTNGGNEALKRVAIFPCLPNLGAPSFYPGTPEEAKADPSGRRARVGRHDFSELYARLSLFSGGKRFAFADSALAAKEMHLAFMKHDESPIEWSWFVNAERSFDVPLLVETSRDKQTSIALAFDRGAQASSNVGDGRACIHVVPLFHEIPPGKSVVTAGRFYWARAEPEQLLERFHKDFPKLPKD
jgi:hypothetical protein